MRIWATLALVTFVALLIGLPLLRQVTHNQSAAVFDSFYRVGSLVFGGGHVVLPLLQAEVVPPGWVDNEQFLAGYGARAGFGVEVVEPVSVTLSDHTVATASSTLVRWLLAQGRAGDAARVLVRPYELEGTVVNLQALGASSLIVADVDGAIVASVVLDGGALDGSAPTISLFPHP